MPDHHPDTQQPQEEVEVFPLYDIPVEMEDEPLHDGEHPCGDPTCLCATLGYQS